MGPKLPKLDTKLVTTGAWARQNDVCLSAVLSCPPKRSIYLKERPMCPSTVHLSSCYT